MDATPPPPAPAPNGGNPAPEHTMQPADAVNQPPRNTRGGRSGHGHRNQRANQRALQELILLRARTDFERSQSERARNEADLHLLQRGLTALNVRKPAAPGSKRHRNGASGSPAPNQPGNGAPGSPAPNQPALPNQPAQPNPIDPNVRAAESFFISKGINNPELLRQAMSFASTTFATMRTENPNASLTDALEHTYDELLCTIAGRSSAVEED